MSEVRKRVYRSELRDEQARATRRRVVDAAADLFTEAGSPPPPLTPSPTQPESAARPCSPRSAARSNCSSSRTTTRRPVTTNRSPWRERPALQEVMTLARTDPRAAFRLWAGFVTEVGGRIGALHLRCARRPRSTPRPRRCSAVGRAAGRYRCGPAPSRDSRRLDLPAPTFRPGEAAAILHFWSIQRSINNWWSRTVGPSERFHVWLARTLVEQVIRPEP